MKKFLMLTCVVLLGYSCQKENSVREAVDESIPTVDIQVSSVQPNGIEHHEVKIIPVSHEITISPVSLTRTATIDLRCPDDKHPHFAANPDYCNAYYQCIDGVVHSFKGPEGYVWNMDSRSWSMAENTPPHNEPGHVCNFL